MKILSAMYPMKLTVRYVIEILQELLFVDCGLRKEYKHAGILGDFCFELVAKGPLFRCECHRELIFTPIEWKCQCIHGFYSTKEGTRVKLTDQRLQTSEPL